MTRRRREPDADIDGHPELALPAEALESLLALLVQFALEDVAREDETRRERADSGDG
jgi:hypothetical protein